MRIHDVFTVVLYYYQVLDSMTAVAAPVLPYLAEEIHSTLHEGDEVGTARFSLTFSPTA